MDLEGLLDPSEIAEARVLIRQGLKTVLDLDEPPKSATIRRFDENTGTWGPVDANSYRVAIDWPGTSGEAGASISQGAANTGATATIEAFAPFPIALGDRLTIAPDGYTMIVTTPGPRTEFGIVTARVVSEEGAR